jgi:hypothetical protein
MTSKQDPPEPDLDLDLDNPAVAAFLEAEAQRASAPFVGLFPEDVLEAFRERTMLFMATHPEMVRLVRAAMRGAVPAPGAPENKEPEAPAGEARPAAARPAAKGLRAQTRTRAGRR